MSAPKLVSAEALNSRTIELTFDQAMQITPAFLSFDSYSIEPALAHADLVKVTNVGSTKARINLVADMLDGQAYTATIVGQLKSFGAGESIDPDFDSLNFAGIGDAPQALSSEALSSETVSVTFSEPMNVQALGARESYSIVSLTTGQPVIISAATPIVQGGLALQVNLTIASKMTDAQSHELEVSNMIDAGGNVQAQIQTLVFVGIASLPRVTSAELLVVSGKLLVSFDSAMRAIGLNSLSAFAIVAQNDAPPLYYSEVDSSSDRMSVKLTISEPKNGTNYLVAANPSLSDDYGNAIDPAHDVAVFVGVGIAPVILRAVAAGTNRLDVVFSKPMKDSATFRDESRWTISGGLSVVKVLSVELDTVKLATTDQIAGVSYTLTIA